MADNVEIDERRWDETLSWNTYLPPFCNAPFTIGNLELHKYCGHSVECYRPIALAQFLKTMPERITSFFRNIIRFKSDNSKVSDKSPEKIQKARQSTIYVRLLNSSLNSVSTFVVIYSHRSIYELF